MWRDHYVAALFDGRRRRSAGSLETRASRSSPFGDDEASWPEAGFGRLANALGRERVTSPRRSASQRALQPRQPRPCARARVDRADRQRRRTLARAPGLRLRGGPDAHPPRARGRAGRAGARSRSPSPTRRPGHDAALLLRDALLLSLRRGAGPFRSFGQIAVEPRAYQLVPLLMALKLDPVRLLIADDVGIGKTIEAALIARELLDRGDIERFAVLCPPHLVDQWVGELESAFHIRAVAVTAASAAASSAACRQPRASSRPTRTRSSASTTSRASAGAPTSCAPARARHRRRGPHLRRPPARAATSATSCSSGLAESRRATWCCSPRRRTAATRPRSTGCSACSTGLRGSPRRPATSATRCASASRATSCSAAGPTSPSGRKATSFPRRETKELTYGSRARGSSFFDGVLDYCAAVVEAAGGDERRQRLNFWGTLALMRCVASSPAAAVAGAAHPRRACRRDRGGREARGPRLRRRRGRAPDDDVEPPARRRPGTRRSDRAGRGAGRSGRRSQAEAPDRPPDRARRGWLQPGRLLPLHRDRALPRRATSTGTFAGVTVAVVTGELTADERRERVEALGEAERRLLIATDCLSEGVNLQEHFDAVVHYDLSWNPTRHEQREGRVDRFGQEQQVVRATLIYGANNPVDGAVLEVILRKADQDPRGARRAGAAARRRPHAHAGPDEGRAAAPRARGRQQQLISTSLRAGRGEGHRSTLAATRRRRRSRTAPSSPSAASSPRTCCPSGRRRWRAARRPERRAALHGPRPGSPRVRARALCGAASRHPLAALPEDVRERLEAEGLTGTLRIDFVVSARPGLPPGAAQPPAGVGARRDAARAHSRPASRR